MTSTRKGGRRESQDSESVNAGPSQTVVIRFFHETPDPTIA
jgi:hypothetical protein